MNFSSATPDYPFSSSLNYIVRIAATLTGFILRLLRPVEDAWSLLCILRHD